MNNDTDFLKAIKSFAHVFASIFIVFGFFILCGILGYAFDVKVSDSTTIASADGFKIDSYDVNLDVKENNVVDVTEAIVVNFTSSTKHGIYKYTPLWLKYTSKDGKTISKKSNIYNLRTELDPYTVDTVKGKQRIKIGSASSYVNPGLKKYVIKYTYDMGSDIYSGFDEFIFHAYGDYWGTPIYNATLHVNMPKSIADNTINFFTDKYRTTNINDKIDYKVEGKTLTAKFKDANSILNSSLTLDIELPEGYFIKGSYNYGFTSLVLILVAIFLTLRTFGKWQKYGKDFDKVAQTVEFYPPDGLNSAEIGYIYNKRHTSKKLTVSLIVSLASKGYIKIDEENNKIKITNLFPIVRKDDSNVGNISKTSIEVEMIKGYDGKCSSKAGTMLQYLFKEGKHKVLTTNIDKFNSVKDELINKGYLKIISDNSSEVEKSKKDSEEKKKIIQEKYDKDQAERNNKMKTLAKLSEMERALYDELFNTNDEIILSEHPTIYTVFNDVDNHLSTKLKDKIYDKEGANQVGLTIIRLVIVALTSLGAFYIVEDLDPRLSILYYIAIACIFITFILMLLMPKKTKYGEQIYARVVGFRNFLETVEKEKLEELVMENPKYFYDILPYTYVLEISKKWICKFEDIKMPELDMGTFDYSNDSSYGSLSDITYPTPTYSSSGGGCSSCGGGCSSCGGGCSSCGGGGSW